MHSSKGRVPKLENIQRVRKDNTYKINELSKLLQSKLQDSKKYFSEQPSILYNNNLEQLTIIHQQISNIVDDYFESLYQQSFFQPFYFLNFLLFLIHYYNTKTQKNQIKMNIQNNQLKQNKIQYLLQISQLKQINYCIHQQQNKLTKLQEDLNNDNYVRAIIQICDGKQELFSDKSLTSLERLIQNYQQSQIKIVFDKSNIELFQTYCKKMCYFVKNTQQQNNKQTIDSKVSKVFKSENNQSSQSTIKSNHISEIPLPIVNPITLISETLTNDEVKYQINDSNHFEYGKPQVLVRLEEGGYAAYTVDCVFVV